MWFSVFGSLQGFDNYWFYLINHALANRVMDRIMPAASDLNQWMPFLVIVWMVVMVWGKRRGRIIASVALVAVILTDQFSASLLKPLIQRSRPCNILPAIRLFVEGDWIVTSKMPVLTYSTSFSFPSNHAANLTGQAVFWSHYFGTLAPLFYTLALMVCYSRIYMGLHYPSDVMGGMVIGILVAKALHYPLDRILGMEKSS
jgi:undecaprenyl-diphosphatase